MTPDKVKPYEFHGLIFSSQGNEYRADCPFCEKELHFFVREETGQFNCRRCGEEGNIYSFLQKIHEASIEQTTKENLTVVARDRGIPWQQLQRWGLASSFITQDWLLPAFNPKGKIANIYKIVQDEHGKWKAYSTPTCNLHPFGTQFVNKNTKTLWVCEGPWDGMLLHYYLSTVNTLQEHRIIEPGVLADILQPEEPRTSVDFSQRGLLPHHAVIAVPGASTFSPEWTHYTQDRQVYLLYDNDHPKKTPGGKVIRPGWDGMKRAASIITEAKNTPKTLYRIRWGHKGHDPGLPSGYDVRDRLKEQKIEGLKSLMLLLEPYEVPSNTALSEGEILDPIERTSFKALSADFAEALHFSPMMRDSLAVALAVVFSTTVKTDAQLWLRLIGPPGSGKTTIAECISASKEYAYSQSIVRGFHSGMSVGKKDASLIPKMLDKTVVMKDADTLCSSPNRDQILAELRDIYDGVSRSAYRTGKTGVYENIQSTFLLCGTDELRTLNRSALGDRFLDCEILGESPTKPFLDKAFDNTFAAAASSFSPEKEKTEEENEAHGAKLNKLKRVTMGFINHLKALIGNTRIPTCDEVAKERIIALGQFISFMRARVKRDKLDLVYRPRAELATRLTSQLAKLAISLAIVLEKDTIDADILRIIAKVAWDTSEGFQREVTELLGRHPNGLSRQQIALSLQLAESSVTKILMDMQELSIVQRRERRNNSGIRGRYLHLWELRTEINDLYLVAKGPKLKVRPKIIK